MMFWVLLQLSGIKKGAVVVYHSAFAVTKVLYI